MRRASFVAAIVATFLVWSHTDASAMTWATPAHFTAAGISPGTPFPPTAISCPSTRLCAVTVSPYPVNHHRGPSWIVTTRDPGASHPVWTATRIHPVEPLVQITCARSGVCEANDIQHFYFSADAVAEHPRWHRLPVPSMFTSLSCPTARLCVASGDRGGMVGVSTNPAGRHPRFRKMRISTATAHCPGSDCTTALPVIVVATCPAASSCIAIDDAGNRFTTAQPTGGAGAWHVAGRFHRTPASRAYPAPYLGCIGVFCPGLDCPSRAFCAGVSWRNFFTAAGSDAPWNIQRLPAAQAARSRRNRRASSPARPRHSAR